MKGGSAEWKATEREKKESQGILTQWCAILVAVIIHEGYNVLSISLHDIQSPYAESVCSQRFADTDFGKLVLPPIATTSAFIFLWVKSFDVMIWEWFLWVKYFDVMIWEWFLWVVVCKRNLGSLRKGLVKFSAWNAISYHSSNDYGRLRCAIVGSKGLSMLVM